jgi:type I restriction enzyme R subunit
MRCLPLTDDSSRGLELRKARWSEFCDSAIAVDEGAYDRADPTRKAKEVTIKLTARLRKHAANPAYKALAERLEDLKNRHQQGLLVSIDFLKELLDLAKEVVKLERETPVEEEIDRGRLR